MRPVVFINVDGVLHPVATQYAIALGSYRDLELPKPFSWADSLQSLAERIDLAFVFQGSSTQLLGLDGIKALAPGWLQQRVIGATDPTTQWPTPFDALKASTTFAVIQRYVQRHSLRVWAAMDDGDDGWPEDRASRASLIRCDPRHGVQDPKVLRQLEAALERMRDGHIA